MTMRERLNSLSVDKQRVLQYAFEQQFSQYVEIDGGKFVGVNISHIKHLRVLENAGTWSYGEIVKGNP